MQLKYWSGKVVDRSPISLQPYKEGWQGPTKFPIKTVSYPIQHPERNKSKRSIASKLRELPVSDTPKPLRPSEVGETISAAKFYKAIDHGSISMMMLKHLVELWVEYPTRSFIIANSWLYSSSSWPSKYRQIITSMNSEKYTAITTRTSQDLNQQRKILLELELTTIAMPHSSRIFCNPHCKTTLIDGFC